MREHLARLLIPRAEGAGECYGSDVMMIGNEAYPVYEAVSTAQRESGLTFDFSYRIVRKAIDVLLSVDDWEDVDAMNEAIDAEIPVYTHELMEIYVSDYWSVDKAVEESGMDGDTMQRTTLGWDGAIRDMAEAIRANLADI